MEKEGEKLELDLWRLWLAFFSREKETAGKTAGKHVFVQQLPLPFTSVGMCLRGVIAKSKDHNPGL